MPIEKRPRGRPRGSGKNDAPILAQVADMIVRDPRLKATTAMKRIIRSRDDWRTLDTTLIRRWLSKWQQQREALMAAAQERARRKQTVTLPQVLDGFAAIPRGIQNFLENAAALKRQVEETVNQPEFRHFLTNVVTWQRQIEETLRQPGVQHFLQNVVTYQRQIEQAKSASSTFST